jgi:hypothetical protein
MFRCYRRAKRAMKHLTADAWAIVNILRNLPPQANGHLPVADLKALFEDDPKLLRRAVRELTAHRFLKFNEKGDLSLTEAAARVD